MTAADCFSGRVCGSSTRSLQNITTTGIRGPRCELTGLADTSRHMKAMVPKLCQGQQDDLQLAHRTEIPASEEPQDPRERGHPDSLSLVTSTELFCGCCSYMPHGSVLLILVHMQFLFLFKLIFSF